MCLYFYALVPAWIKIISLSALNLTFFFSFFFLVEVMAAVSVCVLRTRLRVAQTDEGHETPQLRLVIQTVSLWRWKPSSRLQKSDWLPMPPFAPLAPPRPNLLSLRSHNVMYSNLPPGSPPPILVGLNKKLLLCLSCDPLVIIHYNGILASVWNTCVGGWIARGS